MTTRRDFLLTSGSIAAALALYGGRSVAAGTRTVTLGTGLKAMSPIVINLAIGEVLGYAKEEGIKLNVLAMGTNASVQVAVDKGDADFGVGVPSFGLPILAKGDWHTSKNFYEYTYPYKWDIAVLPDSPIQSYEDLKGKHIGVSDFGATDYPVTKAVLKMLGMDPEKDFKWISVGNGVQAGVALERKAIDALAYYDTGFGQIEAAKIAFRLLPRPKNLPLVGGQFLETQVRTLQKDKELAVKVGRIVCKSSQFILANPRAGAEAFLKMYPETAPRGSDHATAVAAILLAIGRRLKLYSPPYAGAKMGSINVQEFKTEAAMHGWDIKDYSAFYTNTLIDEINDFDIASVQAQARNYR
ncbi:MAG: ABC transporter substrate-binding protein [Castellaniella sp.]|uniref:ABC transporter substrate-binding protein n=1 Tax=Castellaniella sp. TaxID=1955812 RepID=UPI0012007540|nr:ABC transporter substrate-binding protein [Castellaniella sp.]TAN27376.1 MAG: ABC transporter substrate-binding protein [Castellaniella sp.]